MLKGNAELSQSKDIKVRHESPSEKLKKRKNKLISDFISGEEHSFMECHSRILNDYFLEKFESSIVASKIDIAKNPYAIIALGGYGREEQCIHSDVDLLFLFEKNVPDKTEDLIQEIIYPLWDIGLDVGHATRSIKECIGLSGEDLEVLTSVLDARFICGMSVLYSELMRQIREKVIDPVGEARNDFLILSELARRLGYGHLFPQTEDEVLSRVLKGSGFTPEDVRAAGGTVQIPPVMMQYKKWEKGLLPQPGACIAEFHGFYSV